MRELDQLLLNFNFSKNYKKDDFFVSKSNFFAFNLIDTWPKWEKNIINICGEKYSGKTHLSQIFLNKNKGKILESKKFIFNEAHNLRIYQNIILEDFNNDIDEESIFSLINFVDQNNKYLLINSLKPINEMNFNLKDLKSRAKNSLVANIENPDDQLIKVLLAKNFSDRQIKIDNKLIEFAVKRITRSYGKIFEFIYKIDEMSLKMKKSIDLKTVKKVLKV
jgi:chromosomal replication initiation ATPase DnaA